MGAYLDKPKTEKDISNGKLDHLEYTAIGMQGWRLNMEDAHITAKCDDGYLFAIFDGHGGPEVAKFCSKNFINIFQNDESYKKKDYENALTTTFCQMDNELRTQKSQQELKEYNPELRNKPTDQSQAGCTANVIFIAHNGDIFCANAGDSRGNVFYGNETFSLSTDHKPDDKIEKDRIEAAGGEVWQGRVNGNLNLSRAIGDLEYKDKDKQPQLCMISAYPDIKTYTRKQWDFIVMGCDGIWEVKTNEEICNKVKKLVVDENKSLEKCGCIILDELLAPDTSGQSGLDNMSIVIVRKH